LTEDIPEEGVYLYCVARQGLREELGDIGIEGSSVYVLPFRDICAVVHRCPAEPYRSTDQEKAKMWVLAHQYVLDLATERFGTVIPFSFDTILRGGEPVMESWLKDEYSRLKGTLEQLRDRAEYGVQVYVDESHIDKAISGNPEISTLRENLENKPRGTAYLLRRVLEHRIKPLRDLEAGAIAQEIHKGIADFSEEVMLEKNDAPEKGKLMILKLACLVKKENLMPLGKFLGDVNGKDGLTVRFTGPWPPYSFVFTEESAKREQR